VIAAVHGACIGGGVDLISACDVRLASQDAYFSIREVKVGMVADLGTLQRISRIMNVSSANLMAFSGAGSIVCFYIFFVDSTADFPASQMLSWGLLSHVYPSKDDLLKEARKLAETMASQSPLVLAGIKETMNYGQ
jgi:enoyl-CoA hydratase/carnithine racemase